jgi:hypothetical protein
LGIAAAKLQQFVWNRKKIKQYSFAWGSDE